MTIKYKNIILEKIKDDGSLTDKSLSKSLAKDGYLISDDLFNKTLLDLEIMGLITVSWITKNTRRIEIITKQVDDEVNIENIEPMTGVLTVQLRERNDEVNDGGYQKEVVENSPEKIGNSFSVPKVIE